MSVETAAVPPPEARALLDAAFAGSFSDDDWDHALGGTHVLVRVEGRLVAHAALVPRTLWVGGEPVRAGYVEAVATAPGEQGRGHGSRAMAVVNDLVRAAYDLGALSTSRHAFYERLGWERWRGRTYVRDGDRLLRTADEDAGIMVLRLGAALDLGADLACAARAGDDW